jgi:RimJ/RimL family protein N-acetyltransferase
MTEQSWIAPGEHGFLVGETLYLRPLEAADAQFPGAWHQSPFAINPQRAEVILTKEIPSEADKRKHRLVACRRSDDIPVGAVLYHSWSDFYTWVQLRVDPALDDEQTSAIKAEMLRIFVPWRSQECLNLGVWVELDGPAPALLDAAKTIGMRPASCYREAIWHRGARHDQWVYELLHPVWIERLGDPGPGINDATEPPEITPHVRRVRIERPDGPIPANALLVSERVALRPAQPDDWKEGSRLLRRETETFFDNGRWLPSPLVAANWVTEDQKQDPLKNVWLTVILRDTGAIIGAMMLFDVDLFHSTAETGSGIFLPELRGKGIGSESKLLLLEYAFDYLGLHMVRSNVWGRNTRSQAALRKQGYRDAGNFHWQSSGGGNFVDTRTFDLLASEWRERVSRAPNARD